MSMRTSLGAAIAFLSVCARESFFAPSVLVCNLFVDILSSTIKLQLACWFRNHLAFSFECIKRLSICRREKYFVASARALAFATISPAPNNTTMLTSKSAPAKVLDFPQFAACELSDVLSCRTGKEKAVSGSPFRTSMIVYS